MLYELMVQKHNLLVITLKLLHVHISMNIVTYTHAYLNLFIYALI